jgi:hypothetical protein
MNAAAIEMLISKGLSATDILDVARALEKKTDGTNAERQARFRAARKPRKSNAVTVTPVTPPNDNTLTPVEVSETNVSSPQPWTRPVAVPAQVWSDLLENRKRKRLPNTATAWKQFQNDVVKVAAQTGIPPPELIERCTAKGWGAIYDPREDGNGRNKQSSGGLSSTARAALDVFGSAPARQQ